MSGLEEVLHKLESRFDVRKVKTPLSVIYEISAVIKYFDRGPTLIFTRIKEEVCGIVVANLVNTRDKMMYYLDVKSDEELYRKILESETRIGKITEVTSHDYREIEVDLEKLPILKYYEGDAGRYITSAVVIAKDPDTGYHNLSVHRILVLGRDVATLRIVPRHLYTICEHYRRRGITKVPVAVCIGVHPLLLFAASCSPPFGFSEYHVASNFMNTNVKVCDLGNGVLVPTDSEYVLLGYIDLETLVDEGPFADILELYDKVRKQPLLKIEKIYVLRDVPYYHAILPGGAEHKLLMALEREARIWNFVRAVVPHVKAVRLTWAGGCWLHAVISIRKITDGDAKNAIMAAFAAHPSLKHVVVVDEDIDIDNPEEVEWAIATRFRADRGLVLIQYVRGSTLDPSAIDQEQGLTTKMGIDATYPRAERKKFEKARIPINIRELIEKLEVY